MRSAPRRPKAPGAWPVMAAFWESSGCARWRTNTSLTKKGDLLVLTSDSLFKKWTCDRSMKRAASERRVSEANAKGLSLLPELHCTKPADDRHQQTSIRHR